MKKYHIYMSVLLIASVAFLGGCGEKVTPEPTGETGVETEGENVAADEVEHVIKIGDSQPATSGIGIHIQRFGEIIEEQSNGRIVVEYFPAAMLGNGTESMQQVQLGSMDMYRCDASAVYDFGIESMKIPSIPYLFESKKHAEKVLYGEIGDQLLQDTTDGDIGFVGIGWLIEPGRSIFTSKTPVTKLEDAKGLKIRSLEASLFLDTKSELGMNPTPLAFAEVYTALSTGVIDAAANTLDSFVSNKFYEVCEYFINSEQMYNSCPVVFSAKNWAKYSPEDQQLIIDSWQTAMDEFDSFIVESDKKNAEICAENNVKILDLEDKEKWVEAVQPVWAKYGAGYEEMLEEITAQK